jgi:hypothetical protein
MLGGLAIVAFPIAILGGKFLELYTEKEEKRRQKKLAKLERKFVKHHATDKSAKLAHKYPSYPPVLRQIKDWKVAIDEEIFRLEAKIQKLKENSILMERALQLFDWKLNPSLHDLEYVAKLTNEDKESNKPF